MIGKMKMGALAGAGMLAAGVLSLAGEAGAAVYTATYTGEVEYTLTSGTITDFFDGSDVAPGAAFTAVFSWDEADGAFDDSPGSYSNYDGLLKATVTVGTSSYTFQSPHGLISQLDGAEGENSGFGHYIDGLQAPGFAGNVGFGANGGADLVSSWDWRTPAIYDLTGASTTGSFVLQAYQVLNGNFFEVGFAGASLRPLSLAVAREGEVSAAPEPGAWALMIVGFGLAGTGLRRRRTATAAA